MTEREQRPLTQSEIPTGSVDRLQDGLECVHVDQAFVEGHAEELLWLCSFIEGAGPYYTAEMIKEQKRFGQGIDEMWNYSEAIVDSRTGEIVNILLGGTLSAGKTFREIVHSDSGQEIGDRRLYISELVTRPGERTRGKGYASTALNRSMQRAHNNGVQVITLATELSESNTETLDFYGTRGFRPYWFQDYTPPFPEGGQSVLLYKFTTPQ
ncbi:MAG TPA: GNAT family N-acetyltransferase [Candidatus Saccharimonas sp.]|nr:GNAT family N-acetyltransferase [Candidatus Saccharimonas sp.]